MYDKYCSKKTDVETSKMKREKRAKFKELDEYSKSVTVAELNIARNKKLELLKREYFMLQVRNEAMSENGIATIKINKNMAL